MYHLCLFSRPSNHEQPTIFSFPSSIYYFMSFDWFAFVYYVLYIFLPCISSCFQKNIGRVLQSVFLPSLLSLLFESDWLMTDGINLVTMYVCIFVYRVSESHREILAAFFLSPSMVLALISCRIHVVDVEDPFYFWASWSVIYTRRVKYVASQI